MSVCVNPTPNNYKDITVSNKTKNHNDWDLLYWLLTGVSKHDIKKFCKINQPKAN